MKPKTACEKCLFERGQYCHGCVNYALGRVAPMQEQERLISEYDHGDCQWITRHTMANWGSIRAKVAFDIRTFGGTIAGLHPHHVY